MDSFGVTLKANTLPFRISSQCSRNQRSGFWGESVGRSGRCKKMQMNVDSWKNCSSQRRATKLKPGVAHSVLMSYISEETLTLQAPLFETPRADPKRVASIILGGGAGTRLFPLTSQRSKPAVPIGGNYRLIDIPMSNCINSGIEKIFVLTQFNSFSLNRHLARIYNFGNGVNFGDGFVEVLAATQTQGETGKKWFQGTADAVRQFIWLFEDARTKNVENILILSGDHLYRMDYMDFVQRHIDSNADITVSCIPMDDCRASDYGLMKIDDTGRILHFAEKPKGPDLKAMVDSIDATRSNSMSCENSRGARKLTWSFTDIKKNVFRQVDTTVLGLSEQDASKNPYIASMGVYVFRTDLLLKLLTWSYPSCNDFGSEIIPSAVKDYKVQAYLFNDYWEDIGTVKSFFDANLALTEQPPKFEFYDPKTPFYTSPRFLPPSKVEKCRIVDAIISHGCFLRECSVEHSIVGVRSRLEHGVELKDTMMMGADYYQTEPEIASLLADGKIPIGIGENTKIRNCIIDKNAKIGRNVVIANTDGVQEADRPEEGFYIRSGITITLKNATIKDGSII